MDRVSVWIYFELFQQTVKEYNITDDMVQSFLKSMNLDLIKSDL
jgi:hypothetical protein